VVGNIGFCLAKYEINIQQMDLSSNRKGGQAMSFISIDRKLSEEVINDLKSLPHILDVRTVSL
jgi:L-serine dehydratase